MLLSPIVDTYIPGQYIDSLGLAYGTVSHSRYMWITAWAVYFDSCGWVYFEEQTGTMVIIVSSYLLPLGIDRLAPGGPTGWHQRWYMYVH